MQGNNFNQRMVVHLPNDICRTLIGQGHAGMKPKVIIEVSDDKRRLCIDTKAN